MRMKTKCEAFVLACAVAAQAQSPALTKFHDSVNGVAFRYPAQWSSGNSLVFYLGSLILIGVQPGAGPEAPQANVGFNATESKGPYAGTNLNGIQFVYHVAAATSPDEARKRIWPGRGGPKTMLTGEKIHGVAFDHAFWKDAGLGHQADRDIYATFRDGHCYMFEEDIHTVSMDNVNPLTEGQLKQLRRELDSVMQSVRIRGAR